jgi:hypothetical protein
MTADMLTLSNQAPPLDAWGFGAGGAGATLGSECVIS